MQSLTSFSMLLTQQDKELEQQYIYTQIIIIIKSAIENKQKNRGQLLLQYMTLTWAFYMN